MFFVSFYAHTRLSIVIIAIFVLHGYQFQSSLFSVSRNISTNHLKPMKCHTANFLSTEPRGRLNSATNLIYRLCPYHKIVRLEFNSVSDNLPSTFLLINTLEKRGVQKTRLPLLALPPLPTSILTALFVAHQSEARSGKQTGRKRRRPLA